MKNRFQLMLEMLAVVTLQGRCGDGGKAIDPKRENKKGRTDGGVLPKKLGIEIQGSADKNQFNAVGYP